MSKLLKLFLVFALVFTVVSTASAAEIYKYGSRGTMVTEIQTKLGVTPVTGYFGPITKAAVMAFQTANPPLKADGIVGPMTLEKLMATTTTTTPVAGCGAGAMYNSMTGALCTTTTTTFPAGCTSAVGFSPTTGAKCDGTTTTTFPAGCTSAVGFSPTTGAKCDGTTTPSTSTLSGIGSVEEYKILTTPANNREVGEGEKDVKVAGISIEAGTDSDLTIKAVKLVFDEGNATRAFYKFAKDVSLMLGSTKIATVDADEFTSDNAWTKTISVADGAVVKAGKVENLYVLVSGVSNLDSGDAGKTWDVDITSIRWVDGQGGMVSEDPTLGALGGAGATAIRTFSFETLATATDLELKLSENTSNPDAQIVEVSTTDATDGVLLFKGNLKATGGDIMIKELTATITPGGTGDLATIASAYILKINGEEVQSLASTECVTGGDVCDGDTGGAAVNTYLFDDVDVSIPAGSTYTVEILADLNELAGDFDEGDSLTATIANVNTIVAWDSGENALGNGLKTGSVTGNAQTFRSTGVNVTMGTTTYETVTDSGNTVQVTYIIPLTVTSFGNTLYTGLSAQYETAPATITNQLALTYELNDSTAPGTSLEDGTVSSTLESSDAVSNGTSFRLDEGITKHFTLKVIHTTPGTASRSYRVALEGFQTYTDNALTAGELIQTLAPAQDYQTGYKFITN